MIVALAAATAGCQAEAPPALVFTGTCDASAALEVAGRWVVANDEDDVLRVYDPARPGAPLFEVGMGALFGVSEERDLEAVAGSGDETWWIGSHGAERDGDPAPARRVVLPTRVGFDGQIVTIRAAGPARHDLLDEVRRVPGVASWLDAAAVAPPKTPAGLNLEGAARGPNGSLFLGLRGPLDGRNARVIELPRAGEGRTYALDLGGRGVRDLAVDGDMWVVLAGEVDASRGEPAVFRWRPGETPQLWAKLDPALHPEAVVHGPGGWWVLSDDGSDEVNGRPCKELPVAERRFRAARIVD